MRLLLFTQTFPFGPGEAFLEPELEQLRRSFDIVVVPARRHAGPPRQLPDGVRLDTSLATRSILNPTAPLRMPRAIASAIGSERRRWRDLVRSPRRIAFLLYYLLRGARAAHWIRRFASRVRAGEPFLVYCYWSNAEAFGAALAADRSRIPFVCRAHGGDLYERPDVFGYLPFRSFITSRTRLVMTVSDHGREHLIRRHPSSASKVFAARIPIDLPDRSVERPCDDPIVIASCSSASVVKRLPLIAETVCRLASQGSDRRFKWVHVGLATTSLRELVAPHRPPQNLQVEGFDWMPSAEVRNTLLRASPSVFVNLSSTEGLPITVIEALGLGIPVVATNAGGTGEFVDDAVGALLPVDTDSQEAAAALARTIERRDRLRTAASTRVLERCDPGRAGEAIVGHLLAAQRDEGRAP